MKAKFASLLVVVLLTATAQLSAQRSITVEAINDDISYYLDLKAVATVFGDSRDLEDFERRLNDYDSQISNLDLNSDGEVDYLRVIETSEKNVHLVVIQAVLDRDVYQDVATIVVERDKYRRSYVQVVGDPFLYGYNYIIEPVYYRTPYILSWFWTPRYHRWVSPYYWGYYPHYYHRYRPIEINLYMSHIHSHINHHHNYRYADNYRSERAMRLHNSVSRNDYGQRHPERNFNSRHADVTNRAAFDKYNNNRGSQGATNESGRRSNYDNSNNNNNRPNSGTRNEYGTRTDNGSRNQNNNSGSNSNVRTETGRGNSSGTYNRGSNSGSDNHVNRDNNQNRPTTVTRPENRSTNVSRPESRSTTVNRESNSRPTVSRESGSRTQNNTVVKPSRPSNESRGSERKPDVKPSTESKKNDNASSRSGSRR
jgi:hypothetical protein